MHDPASSHSRGTRPLIERSLAGLFGAGPTSPLWPVALALLCGGGAVFAVLAVCVGIGFFALNNADWGRPGPGRAAPGDAAPGDAAKPGPFGFAGAKDRDFWNEDTPAERDWLDKNKPVEVQFLTDLPEFDVQMGPWQFGKHGDLGAPGGKRITVQGRLSDKGLGVHPWDRSTTSVRYRLGRTALAFRAAVALNDTAENFGDHGVIFEVLGDGRSLAVSRPIKARDDFDTCHLDVRGIDVLELRATTTGSHFGCHAVWLDPRVIRRKN